MADFEKAFQRLMKDEGVVLTNDPTDKGGLTFAGISRKYHPSWPGWKLIDMGVTPPLSMVREFYQTEYWVPIKGDSITSQHTAEALFSQYVNMEGNAIKLAQHVVGVIADGQLGTKSLAALNAMNGEIFRDKYCIANMARYHAIGMKDKTQRKYWPGWMARALRIAA